MLYNPRQDETSRDLLAAAAVIKENGWVQRVLWNQSGHHNRGVCAKGALIIAITGERLNWVHDEEHRARLRNALQRMERYIGFHSNVIWEGEGAEDVTIIPLWNDDPVRTKEEVINTFCACAGVPADVLV